MLVFCFRSAQGVSAQESAAVPVHPVGDAYVRDWLVLGPFPSEDRDTDFLANAGGEGSVHPTEGGSVELPGGTRGVWQGLRTDDEFVNLPGLFGNGKSQVGYAYCELTAVAACETEILLWADHSAAL